MQLEAPFSCESPGALSRVALKIFFPGRLFRVACFSKSELLDSHSRVICKVVAVYELQGKIALHTQ